jgi:hypothetical protein
MRHNPNPVITATVTAMGGYRSHADAGAGPAHRGRIGGGTLLLVRVRLFDDPERIDCNTGTPTAQPDVYTDLDPWEARRLASSLLLAANTAQRNIP